VDSGATNEPYERAGDRVFTDLAPVDLAPAETHAHAARLGITRHDLRDARAPRHLPDHVRTNACQDSARRRRGRLALRHGDAAPASDRSSTSAVPARRRDCQRIAPENGTRGKRRRLSQALSRADRWRDPDVPFRDQIARPLLRAPCHSGQHEAGPLLVVGVIPDCSTATRWTPHVPWSKNVIAGPAHLAWTMRSVLCLWRTGTACFQTYSFAFAWRALSCRSASSQSDIESPGTPSRSRL